MIKKIFALLLASAVTQAAFSIPLEELVPAHAARLRQNIDPIIETQFRNTSLQLLPSDNNLSQVVNSVMEALGPSVLVETLYLYNKPENARTNVNTWDNTQKTGIYNQLLAISSLAGIQYYSSNRGAMRTFFETSHVIDNPNTKNRLPDPVHQTPPAFLSIYARQKDLTFGDNVYQYNYTVTGNSIYFIQENVTALTYGIIPVIGRNNLRTILAVFDCGDSLLIYAVSMAKAASVPGMGERVTTSFSNRARAMLTWFSGRADVFFGK